MFAAYLSHPQVRIDPQVPVTRWGLSETGLGRARALAARLWVQRLTRIVSSDEAKAVEAARVLAAATGLAVEIRPGLHENDRSATGYLPPADFEAAADAFFARPGTSFRGWETARAAQMRIGQAVSAVLDGHPPDRPLLLVGHGAVGSLLWLALSGQAITRAADQPPGGGNLFGFRLADRKPQERWTPLEVWEPPEDP